MQVSIRELREDTKAVMDAVQGGEEVTITRRGKPEAVLLPHPAGRAAKFGAVADDDKLPWFGMWADREDMADPTAWVRKLRQPRYRLDRDPPCD